MGRLHLLLITTCLLFGPAAGATAAGLGDFFGTWRGTALEVQGADAGLKEADLDLVIRPDSNGFRARWTALERDVPSGAWLRRPIDASFERTERPGVFAFSAQQGSILGRLFASPATGNPLEGETLLWARQDEDSLILYSLSLNREGGFDLDRWAYTLEDGAVALEHQRRTETGVSLMVEGRLEPAGG